MNENNSKNQKFNRKSSTSKYPITNSETIYNSKPASIKNNRLKSLEKKENQQTSLKKIIQITNKSAIGKVDIKKTFTKNLFVKKPLIKENSCLNKNTILNNEINLRKNTVNYSPPKIIKVRKMTAEELIKKEEININIEKEKENSFEKTINKYNTVSMFNKIRNESDKKLSYTNKKEKEDISLSINSIKEELIKSNEKITTNSKLNNSLRNFPIENKPEKDPKNKISIEKFQEKTLSNKSEKNIFNINENYNICNYYDNNKIFINNYPNQINEKDFQENKKMNQNPLENQQNLDQIAKRLIFNDKKKPRQFYSPQKEFHKRKIKTNLYNVDKDIEQLNKIVFNYENILSIVETNKRYKSELEIFKEKIKTFKILQNARCNEIEFLKAKYYETFDNYKKEIEQNKSIKAEIFKRDNFIKRLKNSFENCINKIIDVVELLLTNKTNKNVTTQLENLSCSIDIYDSYNYEEEKKNTLQEQIQQLMFSKLDNLKKQYDLNLESALEQINKWNEKCNLNNKNNYNFINSSNYNNFDISNYKITKKNFDNDNDKELSNSLSNSSKRNLNMNLSQDYFDSNNLNNSMILNNLYGINNNLNYIKFENKESFSKQNYINNSLGFIDPENEGHNSKINLNEEEQKLSQHNNFRINTGWSISSANKEERIKHENINSYSTNKVFNFNSNYNTNSNPNYDSFLHSNKEIGNYYLYLFQLKF